MAARFLLAGDLTIIIDLYSACIGPLAGEPIYEWINGKTLFPDSVSASRIIIRGFLYGLQRYLEHTEFEYFICVVDALFFPTCFRIHNMSFN